MARNLTIAACLREIPYLEPEAWVKTLKTTSGTLLLRSQGRTRAQLSLLATHPARVLRARENQCEWLAGDATATLVDSPWAQLESWLERFTLPELSESLWPLGGAFGYWGYDLRHQLEPRLTRTAVNDLQIWDCWIGFYPSLLVFDHSAHKSWIVATGLDAEARFSPVLQEAQFTFWRERLSAAQAITPSHLSATISPPGADVSMPIDELLAASGAQSNLSPEAYQERVRLALAYIRQGDIYQVNLSHRLTGRWPGDSWSLYRKLIQLEPAPFSGWLDGGDLALASVSPELFLRIDGREIRTCPIKGTRPRGKDAASDALFAQELRQSAKENAELVMITDLLRNDLGKVCEPGSVRVPALGQLESFPQVHHLYSTVEGRLRPKVSHGEALAQCFPGGSITGAPKIRAMDIIDELEPVTRGPYTGSLGYVGFNGRSQWNILIRTAIWRQNQVWFQTGGGIVADSDPKAEYLETLHKARGFLTALRAAQVDSTRV